VQRHLREIILTPASPASLRRQLRAARRTIDANTQHRHAYQAAALFAVTRLPLCRGRFALYLPNDGELDPTPIAQRLLDAGRTVAVPVVGRGRRLTFYQYRVDAPLVHNRFGIAEPDPRRAAKVPLMTLAVVFVPLVAFDDAGFRLGMGGGYYDATFAAHGRALRVGLAHEAQRCAAVPHRPWDVSLDIIITEARARAFSARGRRYLTDERGL
jgi:5-formyltetrahydrofolate cyclo-ligase